MKTIKIIVTILASISIVSCNTYYRVVTTLDKTGEATREVYAQGDSAFMAGDMSHNPYLFEIGPDWNITILDSSGKYVFFGEEEDINVKVNKSARSIDIFSKEIISGKYEQSFTSPTETLTKKFKGFYTHYTYNGVFKQPDYHTPIPIDKYLSKEEQKLWGQGDFSTYSAMNGPEMYYLLEDIESKFMTWYSHNSFEISLNIINTFSKENIADIDKEELFKILNKQKDDITPSEVCDVLNEFYNTTYFSTLYKTNGEEIDKAFGKETSVISVINNVLSYELILPGEIINTNSPIIQSDTLIWKVDGMRIILDDYTLTAQSRTMNLWFFILSGLILVVAIVCLVRLLRNK